MISSPWMKSELLFVVFVVDIFVFESSTVRGVLGLNVEKRMEKNNVTIVMAFFILLIKK